MPELSFPVLGFGDNIVTVSWNYEQLTASNRVGLRKGTYYSNLVLVDAQLTAHKVDGATKIRGRGRFRGWNIFLNQAIEVRLHFAGNPIRLSLDDVKSKVFESFKSWSHGWEARGDFHWLKKAIKEAASVEEIAKAIDFGQPCEP